VETFYFYILISINFIHGVRYSRYIKRKVKVDRSTVDEDDVTPATRFLEKKTHLSTVYNSISSQDYGRILFWTICHLEHDKHSKVKQEPVRR
jgi:hypothetical protein